MKLLQLLCLLLVAGLVQAQNESLLMEQLTRRLTETANYSRPWGPVYYQNWLDSAARAGGKDVADYTFSQGISWLEQRNYNKAVPLLEEACRLKPKHHGYVGWVYLDILRDYPRALTHYDAYDALTPDVDDREGDHAVSYLRAEIYRFMGRPAEALPGYDKAIALIEDKQGPTWVNYRYYLARGQARLALAMADDALSDFNKAIPNYPNSAASSYWKGRALQRLNRLNEARMAYNDALLWLRNSTVEQDKYYEEQDAVYEQQVEMALASLPKLP
jgi:tetratricopeptide (TPR) repeat protein